MKYGKIPAILSILVVAFVVALAATKFLSGNTNILSIPISGSVGPASTPLVAMASSPSIFVNVATNDPSIVQNTTLTVNDAISNCAGALIYWQSDIPGFFINATGGTAAQSHPYCVLNSTCSCSIQFHSLNVAGTANVFATDESNPGTTSPGGTSVTINWPATPCIGTVSACNGVSSTSACSGSGCGSGYHAYSNYIFSNSNACSQQQGCTWFNPSASYNPGSCSETWSGYLYLCGWGISMKWTPIDEANYPMCAGNISYDCSQLNANINTCLGDKRCLYDSTTSKCYDKSCSAWNSDSATCNSIGGCNYATSPCAGNAVSCDSITDQNVCSNQNGCTWAGWNPSSPLCHSVSGTTLVNSTPCSSFTTSSCSNQVGCTWSNAASTCSGSNNYTCSSFNSLASQCNSAQVNGVNVCSYDYATSTCTPLSCYTWNTNSSGCQASINCNYELVNNCVGNSATCDSFNGNQNACQSQSGCQWGTTPPLTTTTTTTTPSASTTTTTTTTTTTAPTFTGNNFACSAITNGWLCNVTYNDNLGENALVLFVYTNSNGNVVSSPAPVVQQGSGIASSAFYCTNYPTGTYYAAWKAFRQSDTNLQNPVAWSQSTERQTITC